MDGSIRRLLLASIVVTLAACQPPVVTQAPTDLPPTPGATPTAGPSAAAIATLAPTAPPTSLDLPTGFDAIPWARMPVAATSEFVVTIGVLGKPATTTRTFAGQPEVWADGPAVLIDSGVSTEIIDARTGQTMATFDRQALRVSQDGIERKTLYDSYIQKLRVDVARGYLYEMSANRSGLQLRRFALDGSNATLLAVLAPDPGLEPWSQVDFVLADDGTVVATACPPSKTTATDLRCRLFQAAAGASGPINPRYLPLTAPRPCHLLAADATYLIGSPYEGCRADGGAPQTIPYMALNLSTLKATVVSGPSDLFPFGMLEEGGEHHLVANLVRQVAFPSPFPLAGVVLRFEDLSYTLAPYIEDIDDAEQPRDPYEGYAWAFRGRGAGWTLLHGFGPDYVNCVAGLGSEEVNSCPSGPEILETPEGRFVLPPGTWGEIVPPFGSPSF